MANRPPDDESSFPWAAQWPEIVDGRVRAAFARVDRQQFIPASVRDLADRDAPLPIGEGQTISQPYVVALMLQSLALSPAERVLEVGTGSGYQTALLCELTREAGQQGGESIYSVERFAQLLSVAQRALADAGYAPHLREGDGAAGWPEHAPFGAVIVSAAASSVPRPLWEQLAQNGRLVIPVTSRESEQTLWLLIKRGAGREVRSLGSVRFVPLISPVLDRPENRIRVP